jgi:hypothetical protein
MRSGLTRLPGGVSSDADQAPRKKYAGDLNEETSMIMIVLLAPIVAAIVLAIVFDRKQRHRRASLTGHDVAAATRMARADREGRISGTGGNFGR